MSEKKDYPALPKQGENLAKFAWDIVKQAVTSNESLMVSKEISQQRMEICKQCEFYDEEESRCIQCGCWLAQKVKFALDSCPIGKWEQNSDTFVNEKFDEIMKQLDKNSESD